MKPPSLLQKASYWAFPPPLVELQMQDKTHAEPQSAVGVRSVGLVLTSSKKPIQAVSTNKIGHSPQTRLGIRLINTDGILQVLSILSDGILSSSPLKEGFVMPSINSRRCKNWEASRALRVLKESQGELNIVTHN
jgi:hypothetical protein